MPLLAALQQAGAARVRPSKLGAMVANTVEVKWEKVPPKHFRLVFRLFAAEHTLATYRALEKASPEQLARLHRDDLLPLLTHKEERVRLAAMYAVASVQPGEPK